MREGDLGDPYYISGGNNNMEFKIIYKYYLMNVLLNRNYDFNMCFTIIII